MSADLTEFAELENEKKKRRTQVQAALDALTSKKDRENVEAALACPNTQVSCTAISRWFAKRDLKVVPGAVSAYRREHLS